MFSTAIMLWGLLLMESPDTLQTAVVSAERGIVISRQDTISIANTAGVTDILLRSPGVFVSDLGGAAGQKTVSLRGLGSPHTSICVDGIKVSNVQLGQPDLGMLGVENYGAAVVDYAQNSVNFCTLRPSFGAHNVAGRFSVEGGSFGTWLPQGRLDFRLSDKVALSASAAGVVSRGERPNSDIHQAKAGLDLFGSIQGGSWTAKAYYSSAERGTPGAVSWPSTDRQADHNAFMQGLWQKGLSDRYSLSLSGKISRDDVDYFSDYGNSAYKQTGLQLNAFQRLHINQNITLSADTGLQWDKVDADSYGAKRTALSAIAGAAFKRARFHADATLQYEGIFDSGAASHHILSPSVDLRFAASDHLDVVAFARRAYRAPTFNELYYPGYGNPDLLPEDALLTDIGIDWHRPLGGVWSIAAKLDGYYNHLSNKIISAPTEANPSIWLPYNIGTVDAFGLDADAKLSLRRGAWKADFGARYSYQRADGVPYLARHTAVLSADASWRIWSLSAVFNYRGGREDSYGPMPEWNTMDMFISCTPVGLATLFIRCRNLFNHQYELVTGYPVQSRSITAGISIEFK